jgi:hypothetical protein
MISNQILAVAAISAPGWSVSSLWSSLRALQWAAAVSALILTIGAVIEYWEKLKQLTFLSGKWLLGRSKPFERCVLRKLLVHSLGPILVTLGIAGDFIFEGRAFILEDRQEVQAEKHLGSLEDRATALKGQFDTVKQEADAVGKNEDTIDKRVDAASTKLGAVEADVLAEGPRWRLLERGEDTFIKALKPFDGQKVTIVTCRNEVPEQWVLGQVLFNVFPKAGWSQPGYVAWPGCPTMLSGGNEIYFVSSADSSRQWLIPRCGRFNKLHDAGNALCDVLNKLGIATDAFQERPFPTEEEGVQRARLFFGSGAPDGPAELAYKDPGRIFLLIGPNVPMFKNNKKTKPK